MRLWPGTLAGRTFLVLLLGLLVAQAVGLTIHALDRVAVQRAGQVREAAERVGQVWRNVVAAPQAQRAQALRESDLPAGLTATLDDAPRTTSHPPPPFMARGPGAPPPRAMMRGPPHMRPREVLVSGSGAPGGLVIAMRLPDAPDAGPQWLNFVGRLPTPRPWHGETFLLAFAVMSVSVALLSFWAVRRLTRPVASLAAAAERLGRDVNAPPLPETGPLEVRQAAASFNTMAARIKRFVDDRTAMLAAIGHDLRTPITRMKLRAEFVDDAEQRAKMLADLDEMERMIAATMAFARDDAANEPPAALDLAQLLRTVADEANDVAGHEAVTVQAPAHMVVQARPMAMKRALSNLVGNAVAYAGSCRLRTETPMPGVLRIGIEDDGPGIPEAEIERVFLPFHRVERSRSRDTGGIGLGLPIARNIFRAHGGDVVLANRRPTGLLATATLPA
jgi:hypothetical protein